MAVAIRFRPFRKLLAGPRAPRRAVAVGGGFVVAFAAVLAAGELYLRSAAPADLAEFLPESDRTGPFRADPKYGVRYRSLDALAADNRVRFDLYRPLLDRPHPAPTWAFFGSSFVQAPGMLADTTSVLVPQRVTFALGKNEVFPVRFAQAELLLDSGLNPQRVFLVVIPLDVYTFAQHGLDQHRATPGGALAYEPRLPPVGGALVRNSRLALKGWTRTTLHQNRPFYPSQALFDRVDPAVRADVRTVLGHFAGAAARHRVPVTVVLLPAHEQVCRGAGFAVQDALAEDARAVGFDVCDVRGAFLAWPDKPGLFIPDKHFSAAGNRLLLATIVSHLKATDPRSADLPEVRP
ncbi:MAG: hypothetical protein J0I06_26565 [Planctomycetes bacterium]|nr:hypothetical protein [Planctomycetota bacterium]